MEPTTESETALEPATLPRFMADLARRAPGIPAILYGPRVITFAELEGSSRRVARGLGELGVGPGDRVALWLPDVPAWFALSLACARLGAIAVAVNTRFRSAEVEDIVGRSGAKVLALWPGFKAIDFVGILSHVDPAALEALETVILYDEGAGEGAGEGTGEAAPERVLGRRAVAYADLEARPAFDGDHSAPQSGSNIFTTSGTTRAPKFVLHSQAAIVAHARRVARDFGYDGADSVVLQALPLCGVFGFSQAMAALAGARPMVLMPAFEAAAAARLVRQRGVSHMNGSDDMFHRMLAECDEPEPFPSLRLCGFADFNPALDDVVAEAEGRGLRLVGLYGMSEVQALFARQKAEAERAERRLAGGYPVAPEADVRVRDPESGRLLATGMSGELEFQGPSRMLGYYGDAWATARALTDDGFVRSGDLGYMRGDGSFVFLARMGDVLRLGGFLVSPAEIESHVQGHAAVDGCQVVGVAGPEGAAAVAFVTLEPGAAFDAEALRAWCREGMARYKVPLRFIPLDAFPVTTSANGTKIQRARLRDMAAAEIAGAGAAAD